MQKKWLWVGISLTIVVALAAGAYYVFYTSKDIAVGGNQTALGTKDWCANFGQTYADIVKRANTGEQISEAEIQSISQGMVDEGNPAVADWLKRLNQQGANITKNEVCAYQLSTFSLTTLGNVSDVEERQASIDALAQYIPRDRAAVVVDAIWGDMRQKANEAAAKATIASAQAATVLCSDDKNNRITDPQSDRPICQAKSPNADDMTQNGSTWGNLEKYGGKWGGCSLTVTRDATGVITNFQFCAILPSGAIARCDMNNYCTFGN